MVFPFPVFPGFLFVSLSFLSGFPLVFPFPVFPGFPWFPCRFYVVFPWFSLVLEPQENSGKTKRKLQENYRKTPEKPGKTREGENHKPPDPRRLQRATPAVGSPWLGPGFLDLPFELEAVGVSATQKPGGKFRRGEVVYRSLASPSVGTCTCAAI